MNDHVKIEPLVDRTISPTDGMFGGHSIHYFGVGASALENISNAISIAKISPLRILDFGCGAGRVTRWIKAAFPQAEIEGCDIREADIKFTAETFDVQTWPSDIDATKLSPPSSYDLIWVGSVFTHLSKDVCVQLFDRLMSWLNPRGVLVLTSDGRCVAERGPQVGFYGIPENWKQVRRDFEQIEFGYADYADTPGYGISIVSLQWWARLITSRSDARLISMTEHSWDDHQDVIAVQSNPSSALIP